MSLVAVLPNPDSNGIGRYDETISIGAQFSAFLNRALESVSAVIGDLWAWVKPITLTATGNGSVTVAGGVVSFTGCTEVTIYGLPATFEVLQVDLSSSGTAATVIVQTTNASGVPNASVQYSRTTALARNGASTSETPAADTSWSLLGFANILIQIEMKLAGLRQARATTCLARAGSHAAPAVQNTANGLSNMYLTHGLSVAYSGLKFTFSASQTGTVSIRGVR